MKTLLKISGLLLILLMAGCSSTYRATGGHDDVYYTPQVVRGGSDQQSPRTEGRTAEVVDEYVEVTEIRERDRQATTHGESAAFHYAGQEGEQDADTLEYYYDEDGNMVIINNYYYGDYYDFSYASRIRRFHRPYVSFGYYDPFYTNMYWYTHNPHFYGMSIYMGFAPTPFYFGGYYTSWHHRHFWRHYHWHRPWWGWGPSSFWAGYHWGYMAGFHSGFWHPYYYGYGFGYGYWGSPHWGGYPYYYYNSFEGSTAYHYGPRGATGSTVGRTDGRPSQASGRTSFAETFEERTRLDEEGRRQVLAVNETESRTAQADARREERRTESIGTDPAATTRPATQPDRVAAGEARPGQEAATRPSAPERQEPSARQREIREAYQPGRSIDSYRAPSRESYERVSRDRYTRPEQASPARTSESGRSSNYNMPRSYTSPSYQQPSTPQRSRPSSTTSPPAGTRPSRDEAAPGRSGQAQPATQPSTRPAPPPQQRPTSTQPSRTDRGRPSYTPPSRQPSRSTTSPARTSPSRSTTAPSRSNTSPSRSTPPSRSSVGSSSGRSSSPARSTSSSSSRSSGGRNR